jgi:V8-like Glu-specific endopeptidase
VHARPIAASWITLALLVGCGPVTTGVTPVEIRGYGIVGGEETTGWPAVVAYLIDGGNGGLCSATLVGPRTVLTAAHCAEGSTSADQVFFGSSLYEPGATVDVASAVVHDGYNPSSGVLDLGLLILDRDASTDPIALNDEPVDGAWIGRSLHVVGYGNDDVYAGSTAGIKRETDVELVGVDGHLIYHESDGHNTCSGDSGGPVLVERDGGWVLVAVTSFVYPIDPDDDACDGGGGENRVDRSLDWINENSEIDVDVPDTDDDDDYASDDSFLDEPDNKGGCATALAGDRRGAGWGAALVVLAGMLSRRRRAPWRRAG